MSTEMTRIVGLEEGWAVLRRGIDKVQDIIEGKETPPFTSEEYMVLYTTVYAMCHQMPPHDYSQQLYERYRESIIQYLSESVMPSLRDQSHGESMLKELVRRWSNHKVMTRWLVRFFNYLNRTYVKRRSLPPLDAVVLTCFRDVVYTQTKGRARDAVISLIDQERDGAQVDQDLLKNVLEIFVEMGNKRIDFYENDFEEAMLDETAAYYCRKAATWILEDSFSDYMLKAEACLKVEEERVRHYLHPSTEQKLLEKVRHELLTVHANRLQEKENSGCGALLRNDKVGDPSTA